MKNLITENKKLVETAAKRLDDFTLQIKEKDSVKGGKNKKKQQNKTTTKRNKKYRKKNNSKKLNTFL